jgi:nucleotide-binding universal stress UspA family protein
MGDLDASQPLRDEAAVAGGPFADALCAIDGTPASFAAVEQAAMLAGPSGHLTLLAVTSYRSAGAYRSPAIGPLQAKQMIDRAVRIADEAKVPSTVEVEPATPPSQVVLEWAEGRDLLAMGAPGSSWLGGMVVGGVAVSAEGWFTTPLLLARSIPPEQRQSGRCILVASDGLEGSDELVELVGALARAQGASVVLVHALGLLPGASHRGVRGRIQEQARRLQRVVDTVSDRLENGPPRSVIVETAIAEGATLVVMSSRRLKGLRAIGSVSRRVVHQGPWSVLLIPPERLLVEGAAAVRDQVSDERP